MIILFILPNESKNCIRGPTLFCTLCNILLEKQVVYILEDDGLKTIVTTAIISGLIIGTIIIILDKTIEKKRAVKFYIGFTALVLCLDKLFDYFFNFENCVRIGEIKI